MAIVERLTAKDYDAWLAFLNEAFDYPPERGFDKFLPVMWVRDDAHMGKHLVIREDSQIVAGLGIYPLKAHIADEEVLFATCGNVGTHKDHRGKGLMSILLNAAMEEMASMGIDVARLGGQRQRYERFGFEPAGLRRQCRLERKNIAGTPADITFSPIGPEDDEALAFAMGLHQAEPQYVDRGTPAEFYQTTCAWYNRPYLATDKTGKRLGMLSASPEKTEIAELYGTDAAAKYTILKAWVVNNGLDAVTYPVMGYDTAFTRLIARDCDSLILQNATQIKVMNWEKPTNALLRLQWGDTPAPAGKFAVKIDGFGTLVYENGTFAMTDSAKADLSLDPLTATRLFFGHDRPEAVCAIPADKRELINRLLPLPLSWNPQDRV